jgi:prepilin-type N-terminal cleavage/methylation domain-containing protein
MKPRARNRCVGQRGFTLIELLVVIAIIAILAGLLFPVFASVRKNAHKRDCQGNIRQIIQGMLMYKEDYGVYPDGLYGVSYNGGPLELRLYPKYVKDQKVFNCPNSPAKLNSTGLVNPTNPVIGGPAVDRFMRTLSYPQFDSYDFGYRPNDSLGSPTELHYSLDWDPTTPPGITDEQRQLMYKNPPDNTVVTWCLNHSDMDPSGNPARGGMAVVGFLSGRVQDIPADRMINWADPNSAWRVSPKP